MSKREKGHMKMLQNKFKKYKQYHLSQGSNITEVLPDKLQCDFIRVDELGHKVFAFKPSQRFENLKEMYDNIRNTYDPNELIDFVQVNPFYPEAVYDLGEFFRLKGNFKEANKLLERVMFLYEDSFDYDFKVFDNELDNIVTLDYDYNNFTSLFFKAIFKFIAILTKKGCYQSSLEFNKLLLKLNPSKDPLGALLYIDHTALSARKYEFFENFAKNFANHYLNVPSGEPKSILLYPSVVYSMALTKLMRVLDDCQSSKTEPNKQLAIVNDESLLKIPEVEISTTNDSSFWLALAYLLYPSLLQGILEETELSKQACSHSAFKGWQKKSWLEISQHSISMRSTSDYVYHFLGGGDDEDFEGLDKVIKIYAMRNKLLWRHKNANLWMKAVVGQLLNLVDEKRLNADSFLEMLIL